MSEPDDKKVVEFPRGKPVRSYEAGEREAIRDDGEDLRVKDLIAKTDEALKARNFPEVARLALELEGSRRDQKPQPVAPAQIVSGWRKDGPQCRLSTGIEALDALCRGGLPVPRRVVVVGPPGSGKTALGIIVGEYVARSGSACFGVLAVDEDPEDVTVRLAQMAGYTVEEAEARDPAVLASMADALSELRIRLYDSSNTIDAVAGDVASWATQEGAPGVLLVDSLQTAQSVGSAYAKSIREHVEANVRAIRHAADHHRLLVIATSEANRGSYQREDSANFNNDLAAGAESRAIEFGAQTQIVVRTPKDHGDVIHVKINKNRRDYKGEFWLRLDRGRHTVTECENPNSDPLAAERAEREKAAARRAKVEDDAMRLIRLVREQQPLTTRGLRIACGAGGLGWGKDRTEAAVALLEQGLGGSMLVNEGSTTKASWRVVSTDSGGSE